MMYKMLAAIVVIGAAAAWLLGWGGGGVKALPDGTEVRAKAYAVLDAGTGEWLAAGNGDRAMPPASVSKLMTEWVVLNAIRDGEIGWDDPVAVSAYAEGVIGSAMDLRAGDRVTVRVLFAAMVVHSANDAAVALAEHAAGSETAFADRMNAEAAAIGLSKRTRFGNATGLSRVHLEGMKGAAVDRETVMTARDVARLAAALVREFPEVLEVTRRNAAEGPRGEALPTTNEMLPGGRFGTEGVDGMKTGYTEHAGYCFVGTASRDGRRLITVVMGADTPEVRFEETRKLLEYGWQA